MRRVRLGFVLIAIIALPAVGVTQWLRYPTADVPRKADGSPNLTAPAPRLADGKPDFSGLWHVALRNPCNPAVNRLTVAAPKLAGHRWRAISVRISLAACPFNPGRRRSPNSERPMTAATIRMCAACPTIRRVTGDCHTSINSCTHQSCWSCSTK